MLAFVFCWLTILKLSFQCALGSQQAREDRDLRRQFHTDLLLLGNEATFAPAVDYWRHLFTNGSIIEVNDRIISGRADIDAMFDNLKRRFSRISLAINPGGAGGSGILASHSDATPDIDIGEGGIDAYLFEKGKVVHTRTNDYRVMSTTLYGTFVPHDTALNCIAVMRWLSVIWYHVDSEDILVKPSLSKAVSTDVTPDGKKYARRYRIKKWLLTSNKPLIEFEEELTCNWIAPKEVILSQMRLLLNGMYRDADIDSMVAALYDTSAELHIGDTVFVGTAQIGEWYASWPRLGVDTVVHDIDEIDVVGNTVVIKAVSVFAHASGKCNEHLQWYGYLRFNGHGLITKEQRMHSSEQYNALIRVLTNCGDLSPLPVDSDDIHTEL